MSGLAGQSRSVPALFVSRGTGTEVCGTSGTGTKICGTVPSRPLPIPASINFEDICTILSKNPFEDILNKRPARWSSIVFCVWVPY